MWHNEQDEEQPRLGPPIAWAIGAAAIMSVFAVVVMVVNYAPLNKESERRVESALTPATYEIVASIIRATGNSCTHVCSVSPVRSLTPSTVLDVACATSADANACQIPVHYRVDVQTFSGPQR
jgi:hypothetical protein